MQQGRERPSHRRQPSPAAEMAAQIREEVALLEAASTSQKLSISADRCLRIAALLDLAAAERGAVTAEGVRAAILQDPHMHAVYTVGIQEGYRRADDDAAAVAASLRSQLEAVRRDAERWREVRRIAFDTEGIVLGERCLGVIERLEGKPRCRVTPLAEGADLNEAVDNLLAACRSPREALGTGGSDG
jgi:hypothetical protein